MVNIYGGYGARQAGQLISWRPWGQKTTIIQNNYNVFDHGCGGHRCGGGRGNGGFWTAFGITAGLSFLGNLFSGIFGRGAGQQQIIGMPQYGGYQQYTPGYMPFTSGAASGASLESKDLTDLKTLFGKDYTIFPRGNEFIFQSKDGKISRYSSFNEAVAALGKPDSTPDPNGDKTVTIRTVNEFTEAEAQELITGAGLGDKIKIVDGKLSYTLPDGTPVDERFTELTTANVGKAIAAFNAAPTNIPEDLTEDTPVDTPENHSGSSNLSYQKADLKDGFNWSKGFDASYNGKTVDELAAVFAQKMGITNEEAKEMILNANPGAIKDGKVVNAQNLEMPIQTTVNPPATEFSDAEKATPMVLRVVIDKVNLVATVITPDGKAYKANQTENGYTTNIEGRIQQLSATLNKAGWTNVTLRNDNFNINKGASSNSEFDKTRQYKIRIVTDKDAGVSTAMLPDGTQVTAKGYNTNSYNRINDLNTQIKNLGWQDVTLVVPKGKWGT